RNFGDGIIGVGQIKMRYIRDWGSADHEVILGAIMIVLPGRTRILGVAVPTGIVIRPAHWCHVLIVVVPWRNAVFSSSGLPLTGQVYREIIVIQFTLSSDCLHFH